MSAETEQYRERLGRLSYDTRGTFADQDRWEYMSDFHEAEIAGAEAVAAQVLLDVGEWLYGVGYDTEMFTDIATFAAERGIDLEAQP